MPPLLPVLLACAEPTEAEKKPEVSASAIAPGVYAVEGVDEDLPNDDLGPFFDVVGDAQFVGLGETIHTSGGYQQAKFRLTKALIEDHGFRAVGYESPWDDLLKAQDYVASCEGSSDDALSEFLWVWEDIALRDMLEWMCAWNQAHADDPVTIWGWDIQQPWDDGPRLEGFFEEAAPADAEALSASISTCLGVDRRNWQNFFSSADADEFYGGVDPEDHAACMAGLDALDAWFDANQAALEAATSADAVAWARVSAVGLRGWQLEAYYFTLDCAAGYEARDVANTYVLQEIHRLTMPEARSVIWAHNAHLGYDTSALHGWYGDPEGPGGVGGCETAWTGMGTLLEEALGDGYRSVGLTAYEVRIGWDGWDEPRVIPYDPRATEVLLHDLGAPYAFVDLHADPPFFAPEDHELGGTWLVPADQFDGLFYMDHAWAMDWPLPDPYNEGCADTEIRVDGTVTVTEDDLSTRAGAGASVCALDGGCTSAGVQGAYSLCVPRHTNAAMIYDLDGYGAQVSLISPGKLGLVADMSVSSDTFNADLYAGAGLLHPPAPGTGNASGWVADANFQLIEGATIEIAPAAGGVVYLDLDDSPREPGEGTGTGWFLMGGLPAGWYDVTVVHPDAARCRVITGNYTSEGATLHVPIVDGAETYLLIQCTP